MFEDCVGNRFSENISKIFFGVDVLDAEQLVISHQCYPFLMLSNVLQFASWRGSALSKSLCCSVVSSMATTDAFLQPLPSITKRGVQCQH